MIIAKVRGMMGGILAGQPVTNSTGPTHGAEEYNGGLLRAYFPAPPLSRFVELFWYYDGTVPALGKERIMPSGSSGMIIRLQDEPLRVYDHIDPHKYERLSTAIISGVQSRPFAIDKVGKDTLLGIQFKPGGAFPFLGVPANELKDLHLSLDLLWGRRADDLRSRLLEVESVEARFKVAEAWLFELARRPLAHHPAVVMALTAFQNTAESPSVAGLAEQAGISKRRFIELFATQVGLTPKLYSRVQRFQAALKNIPRGPVDWTDLALACGYFDQPHFVNDFREFCGISPSVYLGTQGDHLNHVALDESARG